MMKSSLMARLGVTALAVWSMVAGQKAFAFGYGYGAGATGGTKSYVVSNLNDTGAGSFRMGVTNSGNDVTFSVSGVIKIKSEIGIASNVTIDGTTANITIESNTVSMSGSHNIIIKNIRFREGDAGSSGKCSLQGDPYYNVMIDHCSIEQGRWDCYEATGSSSNITVQFCIIGQGIDPQYFGALIDGANNITLHHNLWLDNNDRNPKLEGNSQYIDNVIYDWIDSGGVEGSHSVAAWKSDFMDNYFIQGTLSANTNWINDCNSNDCWYVTGNYYDMNKDGTLNGTAVPNSSFTDKGVTLLSSQQHFPSVPVPVESAATAVSEAASGAWGCQPLDSFDTTLVGYLKSYGTAGRKGL